MTDLQEKVFEELDRQKMPEFVMTPLPRLGPEYGPTDPDHHALVDIPRIPESYFPHSIIVETEKDLHNVFLACEAYNGGTYPGKDRVVQHEADHARAARQLGAPAVRFVAWLQLQSPISIGDGRTVRPIDLTPSTVMDDLRVSRLGMAVMLTAPTDPSPADQERRLSLGYSDKASVLRLAREYNQLVGRQVYPVE